MFPVIAIQKKNDFCESDTKTPYFHNLNPPNCKEILFINDPPKHWVSSCQSYHQIRNQWKLHHLDSSILVKDVWTKSISNLCLLLMAEILHPLRLVVYPIIHRVSYISGGARFQPSTVRNNTPCERGEWHLSTWFVHRLCKKMFSIQPPKRGEAVATLAPKRLPWHESTTTSINKPYM